MKKATYIVLILITVFATSCSKEPIEGFNSVTKTVSLDTISATTMEKQVITIVNDYRNSIGLNSLEFSEVAYAYANEHTDYMISKGEISHDNFKNRASAISSEVNASKVSENVAKNYETASEAFTNWLASPNHRKPIEGEYTHTAVSVLEDANGNKYFTQLFYKK